MEQSQIRVFNDDELKEQELMVKKAVPVNRNQAGALRRCYKEYPEKIHAIFEAVKTQAIAEGRVDHPGCSVEDNKRCAQLWNEEFAESQGGYINHQSWADFRQRPKEDGGLDARSFIQNRNGKHKHKHNGSVSNGNGTSNGIASGSDFQKFQSFLNRLNTLSNELTEVDIMVLACLKFGDKVPKKFRELVKNEPIDLFVNLISSLK